MQSFNSESLKRKHPNQENEEVSVKKPIFAPSANSAFTRVTPGKFFSNITNVNKSPLLPETTKEQKQFISVTDEVEPYRFIAKASGNKEGEEKEYFTCVKILKNESKEPVKGVLSLDMDETLINYVESKKQRKAVFLNKEKAIKEIKKAKEMGLKIIINTARPYNKTEQEGVDYLSIISILNELLKGYVSEVYFTNGNAKCEPLLYLQHIHNLDFGNILHKDDNDVFLEECIQEGFSGVLVKPNCEAHYDGVNQFLEYVARRSKPMSITP